MKVFLSIIITAVLVFSGTYFFLAEDFDQERSDLQQQVDQCQDSLQQARQDQEDDQKDQENNEEDVLSTYVNSEYSFEISYPDDWFLTTETGEGVAVITNFEYPAENGTELSADQTKRVLRIVDRDENQTAREYFQENNEDNIVDTETVETADGTEAVKIQARGDFGTFYNVFFPLADNQFLIMNSLSSDEKLDLMIESFSVQQEA